MKNGCVFLLILCGWLIAGAVQAQRAAEWLPENHLFQPLLFDPLEAQASGSVLKRQMDGKAVKGLFTPFTIGFRKPLIRWMRDEDHASELTLDLAAFTQFEVFEEDGNLRRLIYDTDYKISMLWSMKRFNHVWRFRFYHLSSHFGDDYIIRTHITAYFPNSVNYEQADVLYSTQLKALRLYGGGGLVVSAASQRKRPYFQAGFGWKSKGERARLTMGADLRLLAQTEYTPNIKGGIGAELGQVDRRPLTVMIEGYTGKIPYSPLEQQHIQWVGLGLYFNPF